MQFPISVKQNPKHWPYVPPVELEVSAAMYAYFTDNAEMMESVVASGQLLQGPHLVHGWRAFDMFTRKPWPLPYFKRQDHNQFFEKCRIRQIQKQLALMFLREPKQQSFVAKAEPYVIGLVVEYFIAVSPYQTPNNCFKYVRNKNVNIKFLQ